MPPENERIFGPHEGESYRSYRERLRDDDSMTASRAAALMATSMLMKGRANKPMDREEFHAMSRKLQRQTAFREMMKDARSRELLRSGNGAALLGLFAEKEAERQKSFERYKRPDEYVREDARFLKTAVDRLDWQAPEADTPEDRRRAPLYAEMMKRLRQAQARAEEGRQLTGEQTKELIGSVMAYNDGGVKERPGGEREASGELEVMSVLSRYMPGKDFRSYCRGINRARGVTRPVQKGYVDPEAYPAERLEGEAKTAEEWFAESRERLMKSFSLEGCAEAAALQKLSGGNPKKVIRPEELDRETARYCAPRSPLTRTLQDSKAREEFMHLATMGEAQELGTELLTAAQNHSARAAQWQVNQSIRALVSGPTNTYTAAENLANILAARDLAASGDAGEGITNDDFIARAERMRADPAFQRLAARYSEDPFFRREMNRELSADGRASALHAEYLKEDKPAKALEQEPVEQQHEQAQPQAVPAM